jgi:hypothetical protein
MVKLLLMLDGEALMIISGLPLIEFYFGWRLNEHEPPAMDGYEPNYAPMRGVIERIRSIIQFY